MESLKGVTARLILLFASVSLFANSVEYMKAQEYFAYRDEVYIKFIINSPSDFKYSGLGDVVSLDKMDFPEVYAYANKEEFEKFTEANLDYSVLTPPSMETEVEMSDSYDDPEKGTRFDFYRYPTYSAYVNQMNAWPQQYPEICALDTLGWTANKRHVLLAMRISNDLDKYNGKPKYLATSCIHGDEVLTMMVNLHMIDTLVRSYGTDARITRLVDSIDFWVSCALNPDGTYKGGNNTVNGSQRYSVTDRFDLNRNYPCFCGQGNHDKYGLYNKTALETKAVLDLQLRYHFHFCSDDHGGIEAIYHPYGCVPRNICDLDWFLWAGKKFANQIHDDCNNNGYFTTEPDGVGHWHFDMYISHGTRIDYATYYGHGKGMGPETSVRKVLQESLLRSRWIYLKEAYFQYFENLLTGIQGFVTNSVTKEPIYYAKMTRNGDFDNAHVYSDSLGFYLRFTKKGTFTLTFSHPDYQPKTISNFRVNDYSKKYVLNVELDPLTAIDNKVDLQKQSFSFVPNHKGVKITFNKGLPKNAQVGIYNMNGKLLRVLPVTGSSCMWDKKATNGTPVSKGCYIAKMKAGDQSYSKNFILGH